MYAIAGDPSQRLRGSEKDLIWAFIEKTLFKQRTLSTCGMKRETVMELNESLMQVEGETPRDEILLRRYTLIPEGVKDVNGIGSIERTSGTGVIGATLKFHVSEDIKKPQWMDVTFGMMYPEPVTDDEVYWIRVDRKNPKDHAWVCDACEKDESQSWASSTVSPAYCINCSANTWRRQMYGGDLDKEKTEGCRSAARLTNLLMHRSLVKLKPSEDFVQFLKETARSVIGNEPEYGSRVMKAVSTYGAIRIPASMVKNIFSEGKGKQYCVLKESVIEDGKEVTYFRVSADYGNVAYSDFVRHVLGDDFDVIFKGQVPKAEKTGDLMEFWLGVFELADMFPEMFTVFLGKELKECLKGLEESFLIFNSSCRSALSANSRKKSPYKSEMTVEERSAAEMQMDLFTDWINASRLSSVDRYLDTKSGNVIYGGNEKKRKGGPSDASKVEATDVEMKAVTDTQDTQSMEVDTVDSAAPDPKRRRKEIKDKFVGVVTEARESKICLYCSGVDHSMDECEVSGVAAVRRSLAHVQAKLTEVEEEVVTGTPTETDAAKGTEGPSTSATPEMRYPNRWATPKPMSKFSKEWIKERLNNQMAEVIYMEPVSLETISNRNEGGVLRIGHTDPTKVGFTNAEEMDDFLKSMGETREIFESPKALMKEIVEVNHSIYHGKGSKGKQAEDNSGRHPMYFPIDPQNDYGEIQIIPDTGVKFFSKPWLHSEVYDARGNMPKEDHRLSKLLCTILRHDVGKEFNRKGHPGMKCDEGAWVNIKELLYNDHIWRDGHRVRDRYGDVVQQEAVMIRYNRLVACTFYERSTNGRMRFQIAALRISNMEEPTVKNLIDKNLLDPQDILKRNGWAYPVAVRCPYGHSGAIDKSGSVQLDQSKICYPIPRFMAPRLGGCFHVTTWDVLEGILENGITRGGARGGKHRLGVYFSLFAPWDERARSGPKKICESKTLPGKRIVIHVPLQELMKLETYISAAGSVLTFADIPMKIVQGMWHEDYKGGIWYRLMLKDGEKQLITQCMNPMYVAKKEKLMTRITEYLGNKNGNKEHYIFIKDMKSKIDKKEVTLHPDREEWGDIVARLTLNHSPSIAGRILCPACLSETFPNVVICVKCQGTLISQGVRQFAVPEAVRSTVRRTPSPERERIIQEINEVVEVINVDDDDDTKTEYEIEMEEPPKDFGKKTSQEEEEEWNENKKKASAIETKEKKDGDVEIDASQPNWLGSQEAVEGIPKWALPIPVAICELPNTNAANADTSAKSAELMDIALFGLMKNVYKMFRKKMIDMSRSSFVAMAASTSQRQDYDGKWPLLTDETGETLRDPSTEEEWNLCLKMGGKNAGTIEDVQSKYRGAKLMYSLCLTLAKAGVSLEELSEHGGQQTQELDREKYSDEEIAQIRRKTSQFMGRVIASAFNVRTYAYFRQDIDWSSHVLLNAVDIMNFPKDEKRYANPLVVIANAGMRMTPKLEKQYREYVTNIRTHASEKTIHMVTRFLDNESANKMLGYVAPTAKAEASSQSSSSRPKRGMDNMD